MILFLITIGTIGIYSLRQVSEKYQHVAQINLQNAIKLGQMDESSREILRRLLQFSLIGNTDHDKLRIEEGIVKSRTIYNKVSKAYEDIPFVAGEAELYSKVESNWKAIDALLDKAILLAKSNQESDKIKFAELYRGDLKKPRDAYFLALSALIEFQKVENIVKNSKEKIEKLVSDGKIKVDTGTRIANECGDVLNDIVLSVASVSKMALQISSASQEQAQGVHEITKAMAQLDQVTQQNSASSAESANAAESLSAQAESLNNIVQNLVQTIEGGKITERKVIAKKVSTKKNSATATNKPATKQFKVADHKKSEKNSSMLPSYEDIRFTDV